MTIAGAQPARRIYVDTTAYLAVLVGEKNAATLARALAGAEVLSSVLLVLEARRNLVRLTREGSLTAEQYTACMTRVDSDIARLTLRDFTLDLCAVMPMPAITTPRSVDLAHLRTALWFHQQAPIDAFMTLDTAQAHAAREIGLPVHRV